MTIRFLIDDDVETAIVKGLRLRAPVIDLVDVKLDGLKGTPDEVLLERAWVERRMLVTNDRGTMPRHFAARLAAGRRSSGVCILSREAGLGELIDALLLV